MLNVHHSLHLAQTACLETFHADAHIVAQPTDWHPTALRLINAAYRRVSDICRDADDSPETVAVAQKVAYPLITAIQYMETDMYGMAQPFLEAANGRFPALLGHLRELDIR